MDISTKQRPELYLEHVWRTGACAGLGMSILHNIGPELHLHLSTLQRPLLNLYEIATCLAKQSQPVLTLDVFKQKWPELDLKVSAKEGPELHLDVRTTGDVS
jgi:hypothetical protein